MTLHQANMFDQLTPPGTINYSLLLQENRNTGISWATDTWNPVAGCSKVDTECDSCYAEALSLRRGWSQAPWTHDNAPDNVKLHPERIAKVKKFRPGAVVFVNSMSDLWHHLVPDSFIQDVFDAMRSRPDVLFLVLTKRPSRAAKWQDWPANVWQGASCGRQESIHRVRQLRACKAAVLFLSVEPMISPVNLHGELTGIGWVIVGGESGGSAAHPWRQMDHAWARDVRTACQEQGTAFFFKQSAAPRTEMGTSLMEICTRCQGEGVIPQHYNEGALTPWTPEEIAPIVDRPHGVPHPYAFSYECADCGGKGYRRYIWHQYPGNLADPVEDRTDWPAYYTPGNMSAKATRNTP